MNSSNGNRRGFPYTTRPTGWFQLGWSEDFTAGEVQTLHRFGQDLIAYRGESGAIHLLDAYCPHLGAHLGFGGEVRGDDIVCPFHAWRFDGQGRNVEVPYSERKKSSNSLECWTVHEDQGIVYFWHDVNRLVPQWDPPAPIADPSAYYPIYPNGVRVWKLRLYPQFIPENAVDYAHFQYAHKAAFTPRLKEVSVEGYIFRTRLAMIWGGHAEKTWLTPDGPVEGELETELQGVGINIARFHGTDGAISLVGITPVDDEYSMFFMTNWVERLAGDTSDESPELVKRRFSEQTKQAERDHVIWENLHYREHPATMPEETEGYKKVRDWARTFYPGEPEYDERVRDVART